MTNRHVLTLFSGLLVLLVSVGCSYTRHVPEGEYLLMENEVEVKQEPSLENNLRSVIKQKPNRRGLFGFGPRTYLMIYNWGNPEGKSLSRWFTRIGEAPVIVDSLTVDKSAKQMGMYLLRKGYFRNSFSYQITRSKRNPQKASVAYTLWPGPRFTVQKIEYRIFTPEVASLVNYSSGQSLLETDQPYDADLMEKERTRIVDLLRNNGYFNFPKELIHFQVDTTLGNLGTRLVLIIEDYPVRTADTSYVRPHEKYYINKIYVDPEFSYREDTPPVTDTVDFRGYSILMRGEEKYRPRVFHDAIHFEPGDVYEQDNVLQTYKHVNSLRIFRSSEIAFAPDSTRTDSLFLNGILRVNPLPKRNFTTELQGTNTSGNFGISGSISWLNRNIFNGGEIFQLRLNGGLEAQLNTTAAATSGDQVFNTFELGAEASFNFPKFLLPVNTVGLLPKRMVPKSRVLFGVSRQSRLEFDRTLFNTGLEYSWKEDERKTHIINLVDVNFTRVDRIDLDYLNSLQFPFGLQTVISSSSRYTFIYNDLPGADVKHRNSFRGALEVSGNTLGLLLGKDPEAGVTTVLNTGVSQYLKVDVDYRHYWDLAPGYTLAGRLFGGVIYAYGNGGQVLPLEKLYFGGGTNDLRAWNAYRLGPGEYKVPGSGISIAPIKLMGSVELRFPIFKALKGGLFTDAGNIWFFQPELPIYEGVDAGALLHLPSLLDDLAVGSGFGLRYDFDFFVIRLDAAYPMRTPYTNADGEKWFTIPLSFNTLTFNLGLGYPF